MYTPVLQSILKYQLEAVARKNCALWHLLKNPGQPHPTQLHLTPLIGNVQCISQLKPKKKNNKLLLKLYIGLLRNCALHLHLHHYLAFFSNLVRQSPLHIPLLLFFSPANLFKFFLLHLKNTEEKALLDSWATCFATQREQKKPRMCLGGVGGVGGGGGARPASWQMPGGSGQSQSNMSNAIQLYDAVFQQYVHCSQALHCYKEIPAYSLGVVRASL